ncbi:50S ribosomal protein L17 [Bdellovibrio sp. BCCA]|uniref:50S ribosomal protein L17 n=1 Tax=Bdellovibrio sp. BCCA TaxID=3136281 RepID=UPI0030F204A5
MSSHRRRVKHFDRKSGPRKALLRGLVTSLIEHGRITTTVDRAKEVRRHVERAITLGKKGDLATTRLLMSRYPNKDAVAAIVKDLAPRFKTRPGGYTRIIKIGRRPGDTAEMAFLEFVDYDFEAKGAAKEEAKATKAEPKAAAKKATTAKKASTKLVAAKKKSVKKTQKKARAAARA